MTALRTIAEWRAQIDALPGDPEVQCAEGRGKQPTLRVGSVTLHSRYNPEEEARRL